MRTIMLSLAAATAMLSAATLTAPRAEAMTLGSAAALQQAIQDTAMVQEAAWVCRHRWRTSRQVCGNVVVCRHRGWTSRRWCY